MARRGAEENSSTERSVERFLGEPTRDLDDWRWLWDGDRKFPIRSHRGVFGRLLIGIKKILSPFATAAQADLWERQRIFNLIALEYLQRGEDIRRVVLETQEKRFEHLEKRFTHYEALWRDGLTEVVEHNDALFARVDQKLDRSRREMREVWARLASALAVAETGGAEALSRVRDDYTYLDLERRFRGTPDEIADRIRPYVERLKGRGEVLDLGCGRGEALAVLAEAGIAARGVDGSAAMIEECRGRGLRASRGDLFEALAETKERSLGGVVSFHVIEHLPPTSLDRLVRLAFRALEPGGVLILETPSPLSLVMAAGKFWIDPTHQRPVHPDTLEWTCRSCGFDPVERLELHRFDPEEPLPEIDAGTVDERDRPLALALNELRDRLDDLLFGAQDFAVVATRP